MRVQFRTSAGVSRRSAFSRIADAAFWPLHSGSLPDVAGTIGAGGVTLRQADPRAVQPRRRPVQPRQSALTHVIPCSESPPMPEFPANTLAGIVGKDGIPLLM